MPALAICSALNCDFQIGLQDPVKGTAVITPLQCPSCGSKVLSLCPSCGFLLVSPLNKEQPTCSLCGCNIKSLFAAL